MMDVKPLHNENDYDWAIREVTRYFENEPELGTHDGDRFEVLSILIKDYENKHFATPHGDPVDVLHFAIASMGKSQAELATLIGRNRASEVLSRTRPLTLDTIRTISKEWNIPIDVRVRPRPQVGAIYRRRPLRRRLWTVGWPSNSTEATR